LPKRINKDVEKNFCRILLFVLSELVLGNFGFGNVGKFHQTKIAHSGIRPFCASHEIDI
jgi:hypothetical protein